MSKTFEKWPMPLFQKDTAAAFALRLISPREVVHHSSLLTFWHITAFWDSRENCDAVAGLVVGQKEAKLKECDELMDSRAIWHS